MGSSKSEQTINNFIESNRIVYFSAESPSTSDTVLRPMTPRDSERSSRDPNTLRAQ